MPAILPGLRDNLSRSVFHNFKKINDYLSGKTFGNVAEVANPYFTALLILRAWEQKTKSLNFSKSQLVAKIEKKFYQEMLILK